MKIRLVRNRAESATLEAAGKVWLHLGGTFNPYLKSMLCEIGWVISGKRTLYLSGWYWRIKQRKGAKRATIALAHKLLTLTYTMLKTKESYNEDCFEQCRKRCERKRAHRMVNELQKLGYMVVPPS